jgi:hypothetical protein
MLPISACVPKCICHVYVSLVARTPAPLSAFIWHNTTTARDNWSSLRRCNCTSDVPRELEHIIHLVYLIRNWNSDNVVGDILDAKNLDPIQSDKLVLDVLDLKQGRSRHHLFEQIARILKAI